MPGQPIRPWSLRVGAVVACLGLVAGTAGGQVNDWVDISPAGSQILYALDFPLDSVTGYVCGANGVVSKTTDGGRNWTSLTLGETPLLTGVGFADNSIGVITADNGKVYRTIDGGSAWSPTVLAGGALNGIHFATPRVAYAVGATGDIFKSVDAGANFVQQDTPVATTLESVDFPVDGTTGWIAGAGGVVLKRTGQHMVTGVYAGDGNASHAITGLGFQPDVVIVRADTTTRQAFLTTSAMPAGYGKGMGAFQNKINNVGKIASLDADGFTVGSHVVVNDAALNYYFYAWTEEAGVLKVGTYIGNGSPNSPRWINIGMQPAYVISFRESELPGILPGAVKYTWNHRFSTQAVGACFKSYLNEAVGINRILDFDATGFQIGNNYTAMNDNNVIYHYIAWAEVAGKMKVGTYTGINGNDDRVFTGLGFRPEVVLIESESTIADDWTMIRSEAIIGDHAQCMGNDVGNKDDDAIQRLDDDGFQIGTTQNTDTETYHWVAWGGKWNTQTTPTADDAWTVDMFDESDGLVACDSDTIFKTINGGTTWTAESTGVAGNRIGMSYPSASIAYTAGAAGKVFNSTDAGVTWTAQTTDVSAVFRAIRHPEDSFTGFVAGNAPTVLRTRGPLVMTGKYFGDGTDNRAITGAGFRPDAVIIKGDGRNSVARTSTMIGDATKPLDAGAGLALAADRIQTLDADGFTLGTDATVNESGVYYFWTALRAESAVAVGTYTGDDADDRSVGGVGFEPDYLIVMGEDNVAAYQRFATMTGDMSFDFDMGPAVANNIQAFEPDGFQVGDSLNINVSPIKYHYIAVKEVPLQVDVGSYAGNTGDDRDFTAPGLRPEYLIVRPEAIATTYQRLEAMGMRDTTFDFANGTAGVDLIQTFLSNGFQVGTAMNESATTYHWVTFMRGPGQPDPTGWVRRWAEVAPQ